MSGAVRAQRFPGRIFGIDKAYPKKWELNFPSFSAAEAVTCPVSSISHHWGGLVHKILEDLQGGKQLRAGTVRFSQGESPMQ